MSEDDRKLLEATKAVLVGGGLVATSFGTQFLFHSERLELLALPLVEMESWLEALFIQKEKERLLYANKD